MDEAAKLAQRVAELPADRQEALRRLLKRRGDRPEGIRRRRPGERIPLTSGQERLWLLDRLVPGNPAYNETNTVRMPYAVDPDTVRRAVAEIVRRHEALRTIFRTEGEEPVQVVLPTLCVDVPLVDLRHLPQDAREDEALRLAAEQSRIPFDLSEGPLLRTSLFRLDAEDHLFSLTLHHIVTDGWSIGVFCAEFFTLYWSFAAGRPSPLPELAFQYGDYAIWQRAVLDTPAARGQLDYWRRQLADLPQLDLPGDRPRPAEFSFRGAARPLTIGEPLYRSLQAVCDREGVTLFVLLLSALYVLLHRYTDQDELVVGTPSAGRNRKELEPLMGFFVNTLVLRADLSGNPRFTDLLARVRATSVEAMSNQDVPFERILDALQLPRDKSRTPLFQVGFQLFQRPSAPGLRKDLLLPFEGIDAGNAKFDLTFQLIWTGTGVRGQVEYATDLFDHARIERLIRHYGTLLAGIAEDAGQRVGELRLLSPEEERRVTVERNRTAADYPRDATIPEVFREEVLRAPDDPAVAFGAETLTYAELDERSDRLARRLAALGVERGAQVGVHLERCLDLPAVLLGVLKAGAGFVPLDPAYPRPRLAHIVRDSGTGIVVTGAAGLDGIPVRAIPLHELLDEAGGVGPLPAGTGPGDVAYVMYTSATTGDPKGVAVTHRNILRLVKGVRYAELRPGRKILQFSPISFDASTFEIWGALLNGGTLVLHPPGMPSLAELGAFIRRKRIEVMFLTTALFRQLVEQGCADLRSVRQLLTGGEAMPVATARAAWKGLPRTRVANVYGPTECTTFATIYPIVNPDDIVHSVPIGRPIENTTAYILDRYGNPVPDGIPGELHLGGDGVAPGYWKRPDLTEAAFVPDPFAGIPGARLYRTGDLASFREDGTILFLGRRDRQVKLSGYRIELGEVEAAIEAHPQVSGAAAVLVGPPDRRLAAFAGRVAGSGLTSGALRSFLLERLPRYMVPPALEVRDGLPLTPTGKIDHRALEKEAGLIAAAGAGAPPRTPEERQIAALWEELLHAEQVGIADNFFDLGGQSLVATRLLSRIRDRFQVEVTMRAFFDDPTVAGLASSVEAARRAAAHRSGRVPAEGREIP
jgi:amino acid adenylation domain-containing protein